MKLVGATAYLHQGTIGVPPSFDTDGFWIKITGQGANDGTGDYPDNRWCYEWVRVMWIKDQGAYRELTSTQGQLFQSMTDGDGVISFAAVEVNKSKGVPIDSIVYVRPGFINSDAGSRDIEFVFTLFPGGLFKVKLIEDSSPTPKSYDGNKTTLPVFRYTIKTADDRQILATAQTPQKAYAVKCRTFPQGWGYAYYDPDGTIHLAEDWITYYQKNC